MFWLEKSLGLNVLHYESFGDGVCLSSDFALGSFFLALSVRQAWIVLFGICWKFLKFLGQTH